MKVLVTGGAGFIGSHVVEELIHARYQVIVVDNLSSGKRENVHPQAVFVEADIVSDLLDQVFAEEKPDYVVHLAAQSGVSKSLSDPLMDGELNVLGTIRVLESCRKYQVKKIVYASSAAIYGNPYSLPVEEEHAASPLSFYGISKYAPELYISTYHQLYGLEYCILRYANVFGPRQNAAGEGGVISIFIDKLINEETLMIYGDGEQTRDFVYVHDVAKANRLAIESKQYGVFNISTNSPTSINELIGKLQQLSNQRCAIARHEERPGDIKHSYLSNTRARSLLDWKPEHSLDEGLKETFDICSGINWIA